MAAWGFEQSKLLIDGAYAVWARAGAGMRGMRRGRCGCRWWANVRARGRCITRHMVRSGDNGGNRMQPSDPRTSYWYRIDNVTLGAKSGVGSRRALEWIVGLGVRVKVVMV